MDATLASHFGREMLNVNFNSTNSVNESRNVPKGYHLIYFNPFTAESDLSSDGYEDYQSPGSKFPNRMWLGGSVEFNKRLPLKMNQPAQCIESLHNIDVSKNTSERVKITLDRKMYTQGCDDWSVRELRSLIYFTQESGLDRKAVFERFLAPPAAEIASNSLTIKPTPVTLFRYSALTFNAHRIHYDPSYCEKVEQMPGVVVHGPFTVTLLLRWIDCLLGKHHPNRTIRYFTYRNVLPMFVDNDLTMFVGDLSQNRAPVWIQDHRGSLTVKGEVEFENEK